MRLFQLAVANLAVLAATAGPLQADLIPGGATTVGNSWTLVQGFGNDGSTYDTLEVFIISDSGAGPFQNDGMFDLTSLPGWSATSPNPNYTVASGPATTNSFSVTFDFAGDISSSVNLDWILWNGGIGGTIEFAANFDYINGVLSNVQQSFTGPFDFLQFPDGVGYDRSNASAVIPEPSSLALFGLGTIGLFAYGWQRRRRPAA